MTSMPALLGMHHVTAIASDPQRNIHFYTGVLGLRLVKVTVNFDDPFSYHLYYGNEVGNPGTILTFFIWPGARRGRQGTGQIVSTSFSVPQSSLSYWVGRLIEHGVSYDGPVSRLGERVITFRDPDGLALELVGYAGTEHRAGWGGGTVPAEHAIRGLSGVMLWEEDYDQTARTLTEILGFQHIAEEENVTRYALATDAGIGIPGTRIDVRRASGFWTGKVAVGTVHHVAWRTATDETLLAWREILKAQEFNATPVMDREYFHSVYFPEPGGVLFEIATDPPGFTINETVEQLGTQLQLPPWMEDSRAEIEAALPPLSLSTMPAKEDV
ncbi:ring-cleaving dioxygenase [Dictyobacter arantiisoli]|uniref:Diguanylate cyclase n=1 Tax=Dictyobacter arantiisoli TaxID=2014874 RepID=A0A5A5TAK1_9CHLR|nr:ring-cleaving dioxygenase [Dictyobacter arantiisoli]GCF08377.1 diguanylate cyclase [Dictyobacter arantiisoli]